MEIGSRNVVLLRIARVLFLYVAASSGIMLLGCVECSGISPVAFTLVSSGVAALFIERRNRAVWAIAILAGAYGAVVFVSRVPFYIWQYELAVRNAGWLPFLWANSLFLALAIAGALCVLSRVSRKSLSGQGASAV